MRIAINIPRMLPDNDFHFRLGHAAPAPVSLRAESLRDVRADVQKWGARKGSASSGPGRPRRFSEEICELAVSR